MEKREEILIFKNKEPPKEITYLKSILGYTKVITMKYTRRGKAGLFVSCICLGTLSLGLGQE